MQRARSEEQWVRACLHQALPDVEVRLHDDGSGPGMHDFDLVRDGHRFAALEVTAAADAASLELWKIINGGNRWIQKELAGGWLVALAPTARAKRIRSELPLMLAHLEEMGVRQISEVHGPTEDLMERVEQLESSPHNSLRPISPAVSISLLVCQSSGLAAGSPTLVTPSLIGSATGSASPVSLTTLASCTDREQLSGTYSSCSQVSLRHRLKLLTR